MYVPELELYLLVFPTFDPRVYLAWDKWAHSRVVYGDKYANVIPLRTLGGLVRSTWWFAHPPPLPSMRVFFVFWTRRGTRDFRNLAVRMYTIFHNLSKCWVFKPTSPRYNIDNPVRLWILLRSHPPLV